MKRYEYKTEYLKLVGGKSVAEQLVEAMNTRGADGWRLNHWQGASLRGPFSWRGAIDLILEREIEEA
jgi:hypothetical protein